MGGREEEVIVWKPNIAKALRIEAQFHIDAYLYIWAERVAG